MPLTPEDMTEMRSILGEFSQEIQDKHVKPALERAEAAEKKAQALEEEFNTFRTAKEAETRRDALYGGELDFEAMTAPEQKRHATKLIGDTVRAVVVSKRTGRSVDDVLRLSYKNARAADALERSMQSDVFSEGGAFIETQYGSVIELLYAQATVRSMGATVLPMSQGNLTMPKVVAGATAAYVGEATRIGASQPVTGQLELSAKKLASLVPMSNELLSDTSGRANAVVVRDMGMQLSLREDLAFLRSDGASNTPVGIRNAVPAGNILAASSGLPATPTINDVLKAAMAKVIGANVPGINLGWIFNTDWWSLVYFAKSTTGDYIYRDEMDRGQLMGYPFKRSNQIASNYSGSLTEVYFGDFSEFIIGDTGGVRVDTSNEGMYWDGANWQSAFANDQTIFRALARHDAGLRHTQSFAVATVATNLNP